MEVTIEQASLSRALRLVGRIAPARPALPILQNVLVEAGEARLTLTATDYEVGVTTTLAADVAAAGIATARARLLDDYVAALPAGELRLRLDGEKLRAACGRFTTGFPTADPDEFPAMPGLDDAEPITVDAAALRAGFERVAFSAARDESRRVLRGIRCRVGADGLSLAACDGFRLARTRVPGTPGDGREVILPARAALECVRLLAGAEAARLAVSPDGGLLHLAVGETTLLSRLLEGEFPNVERVVPSEWGTRVVVKAAELRRAIGVAGLFGNDFGGRPVRLDASTGSPGTLRLHAQGTEAGDANVELPAEVEGDAQHVALAAPYLSEVLAATSADLVELAWQGPLTPVAVREVGRDDPEDVWVLMAMHLASAAQSEPTEKVEAEAAADPAESPAARAA